MKRLISMGARLPTGYGVAWVDPDAARLVCFPVPLHLAARAIRRAWYLVARHRSGLVDERAAEAVIGEAFRLGFSAGWEAGIKQERQRIDAELERIIARRCEPGGKE